MRQNERLKLPIDSYLEEIANTWRSHSTVIIKASPGSGKTTRLPWAITKLSQAKVIVLEPRRLAAKLAAQRIAEEEGLTLGEEVGYHFRFEKSYTSDSRLIFYTEGTFLRSFLQNEDAPGVGTVILDEFHERHIETDMALAAIRSLQKRRPEIKIILMSATLDTKLLDEFPGAGLIDIEARSFKVDLHYLPNQPSILAQSLETKIKRTLASLASESGDVLIFVPGMREMRKVQDSLSSDWGEVLLLHGDLSKEEQERALSPSTKRKIILATNIAESSLTIPGIRVVIDSGIQREARYSPWTGLKTLEDRPTTQSSAIQRQGRAGRMADGVCYRLYSEQDYLARAPYTIPEILKADLTDTYLLSTQLKSELLWFTPPPPERWKMAQELSYRIGAVDAEGRITPTGEKMLHYPLGARLSRSLLAAKESVQRVKKDLLRFICQDLEKDYSGMLERRLASYLHQEGNRTDPWERALLYGFIDQVALFRSKQNDFIHYSGKTLKAHSSLKDLQQGHYLVLDITPRQEAFLVVPIEEEWLFEIEPFPFVDEESVEIGEQFSLKSKTLLGSLVFDESTKRASWESLSSEVKKKVLLLGEAYFQKKWKAWQEEETFLRLHYWARHKGIELKDAVSLESYLEEWGALNWDHLSSYFQSTLEQKLEILSLDEYLPTKVNLGGKRDLSVHYPYGLDPYIEAPIQDFYGVTLTPKIMKGQIPLTLKLLGPHKRPIQVTKDIQGFWQKTYQEMKREWQREYPRHHWPDKPESAKPILLKRQLEEK